GLAVAVAHETPRGVDLGSHGSRGEAELGELVHGGAFNAALLGRVPVQVNGVGIGQQHQGVRTDVVGEHRGGEVLVDDGFDAVHRPLLVVGDHGYTAAAHRQHDQSHVEQ